MLVGGPGAVQRLDWKNFNQAKPVKKALKRVKSEEGCPGCKHLGRSNAPRFSVQDPRKHKCTALGNSCPTATERCWDQFRDKAKSCLLLWSLYKGCRPCRRPLWSWTSSASCWTSTRRSSSTYSFWTAKTPDPPAWNTMAVKDEEATKSHQKTP